MACNQLTAYFDKEFKNKEEADRQKNCCPMCGCWLLSRTEYDNKGKPHIKKICLCGGYSD